MRKNLATVLGSWAGLWLLCGLIGVSARAETAPVVTGAGAHFAWVVFDKLKPDLERVSGRRIELFGRNSTLGMGCNAGINMALQNRPGRETFGFVCCPLDEREVAAKGLRVYPIALEPILIVVNRDNPVSELDAEQVRAILRGDIVNWQQVGGRIEPIVLVTRLHCARRPGHWKTILPDRGAFRQQRLNVSSAADMVQRVSDFRGALGHIGSTWNFSPDHRLKIIRVNGYEPTAENLRSHRYPFYRNLSAITDRHPSKDVLSIIREVQTGAAFRRIAAYYSLLPLNPRNDTPTP